MRVCSRTEALSIALYFVGGVVSLPLWSQPQYDFRQVLMRAHILHPHIAIKEMELMQKKAQKITASTRPNPNFNNQVLILTDQSLGPALANGIPFGVNAQSQDWFQLTKALQLNGKRQAKMQLADTQIQLGTYELDHLRLQSANASAQIWLELWHAQNRYLLLLEAQKNADNILEISELRLKNQAIAQSEYLRNKMVSAEFQSKVLWWENEIFTQKKRLSYMLQLSDTAVVDTTGYWETYDYPLQVDILLSLVQLHHPKFNLLKKEIDAEWSKLALTTKQRVPNAEAGIVFNPQNTLPYVGWYFQMPIPILDRQKGEIQQARLSHDRQKKMHNWRQQSCTTNWVGS